MSGFHVIPYSLLNHTPHAVADPLLGVIVIGWSGDVRWFAA